MKYRKIMLLMSGLIISLSSTSYATKQQNNENKKTIQINKNNNTSIDLNELAKEESEKENINTVEKIISEEDENTINLLKYYQEVWDSEPEQKRRTDILKKLDKLIEIFSNWNNGKNLYFGDRFEKNGSLIYKNMSISNSDFNLFQSILLDYYKFSISFNKYHIFILTLFKSSESIKNTDQYKNFMTKYNNFISQLSKNVSSIHTRNYMFNAICEYFFLSEPQDPETFQKDDKNKLIKLNEMVKNISNLKSNFEEISNKDPEKFQQDDIPIDNDGNKSILNEIAKNISNLKSNFKKIFNKDPEKFQHDDINILYKLDNAVNKPILNEIAKNISNLKSNFKEIFNKDPEKFQQDDMNIDNEYNKPILNEMAKNISNLKSNFKEIFNKAPEKFQQNDINNEAKTILFLPNLKNLKKVQQIQKDDINTKTNENQNNNKNILNETAETILDLESNFQKIFELVKIAIPEPTIWQNIFKENVDINNLIDENTAISDLEIMPKQYETNENDKIEKFSQNKIPPHYKFNLHILGTVVKMELIKSLSYLKQLKQYYSKNPSQIEDTSQYNRLKQYINKLYIFYNNLRCLIVYCKKIYIADYGTDQNLNMFKTIRALDIFSSNSENETDEQNYKKTIKEYMYSQFKYTDILHASPSGIKSMFYKKGPSSVFRKYYRKRHNVNSTIDLYNHIKENKSIYDALMYDNNPDKIAPIKAWDKFFIDLDDPNPDNMCFKEFKEKINEKQNSNEILQPFKNIKYIPLDLEIENKTIINPEQKKEQNKIIINPKEEENKTPIVQELSNQDSLNKNIALFEYYYNEVWNSASESAKRFNVLANLGLLQNIFQNWIDNSNEKYLSNTNSKNNRELIYKNIYTSNFDFNLLQSFLLDYYKFSISFNKYNMLISLLSQFNLKQISQEYRSKNKNDPIKKLYKRFLDIYKVFINEYKKFIRQIANGAHIVNIISKYFFLPNSKDPKIFQQNDQNIQTNLNDKLQNPSINNMVLNETAKTILKLQSSFQKIFNLLEISVPEEKNVWTNIFQKNSDEDNLIQANATKTIFNIISQKDEKSKTEKYKNNEIPPHYNINLHILSTVVKMELIKSLRLLKKLNPISTDVDEVSQYNKLQNYVNKLYYFYNYLKAFIVYSRKISTARFVDYSDKRKNKIFKKILNNTYNAKKENSSKPFYFETMKYYLMKQNNYQDILSFSINNINYLNKPSSYHHFANSYQKYYFKYYVNRHKVNDTISLYDHIDKNKTAYNNLINENNADVIAPINSFDNFFMALDNPKNRYFNKFYEEYKNKKNVNNVNDDLNIFEYKTPNQVNINMLSKSNLNTNTSVNFKPLKLNQKEKNKKPQDSLIETINPEFNFYKPMSMGWSNAFIPLSDVDIFSSCLNNPNDRSFNNFKQAINTRQNTIIAPSKLSDDLQLNQPNMNTFNQFEINTSNTPIFRQNQNYSSYSNDQNIINQSQTQNQSNPEQYNNLDSLNTILRHKTKRDEN